MMPIDPEISLNAQGSQIAPADPLSMVSKLATTQNALNTNRLFQQTFAARQKAGQILASAPDLESGLQALYRDQDVAPFAGEIVNSARQGMLAQTQQQGEQQTQAMSGFAAVMKGIAGAVHDPSLLGGIIDSHMATLSPQARSRVTPAVDSIKQSLLSGLDPDPQRALAQYQQRMAGLATAAGVSPETFALAAGKPTTMEQGGATLAGMTSPVTGAFTPATAVGKTLAPQVTDLYGPGGSKQPSVVGGGAPGVTQFSPQRGTGGNALAPTGGAAAGLGLPSPTQQQQSYNEKSGGATADLQDEMSTRAMQLPSAIKRVDTMSSAMEGFLAGGGAQGRATLAKGLQALRNGGVTGITQKAIDDVGNESLSDTQIFEANIKPMVVSALKEAAQGTGRVMRSEVDAFLNSMNSTTDPKALLTLMNQARYALQVGYDQSQKFTQFKQLVGKGDPSVKGLDLSDFFPWYMRQLNPSGLPSATPGGLQLGAKPAGSAKGTGVTKGWTIQGGKLVPAEAAP